MIGEFGHNVGKPGQGEDGEPGMSDVGTANVDKSDQDEDSESDDTGGSAGKSVGGRLLVALVAMSVLAGLYA